MNENKLRRLIKKNEYEKLDFKLLKKITAACSDR